MELGDKRMAKGMVVLLISFRYWVENEVDNECRGKRNGGFVNKLS